MYRQLLAKKIRFGTDKDALVLRLNVQANFPEQRHAQAGPLRGNMRSLQDGSISGLLRKRATANPFTRASCSSWSSNGHTSTVLQFDKKIRSVPHFLQPPAIDKEPESNAKMYVNQRRDERART